VDAVIKSGIKKVVIAMKDPNPLTNGKSIAKLKKAGIDVELGFLEKEARILNEAFVKFMTYQMPFVVGKCGQTLDGKIATRVGSSQWITSEETRTFSRRLRNHFYAILVGINTVLKDDPCLASADKNKRIKKIILDSSLKISLKAKLFKGCFLQDCLIATTKKASKERIAQFQKKGVGIIVCPKNKGKIDLKWLFKELAKKKIMSILIEGGAKVLGNALAQDLVDKMHIYIAPKIVGDQAALSAIDGINVLDISKALYLKNVAMRSIGSDIFISGYISRK
jgi:diaminohydroxyphosphoribosylaminopyrimidine deaminase/5-amino-6-(5-phosphoribosylamino)uracil reductase